MILKLFLSRLTFLVVVLKFKRDFLCWDHRKRPWLWENGNDERSFWVENPLKLDWDNIWVTFANLWLATLGFIRFCSHSFSLSLILFLFFSLFLSQFYFLPISYQPTGLFSIFSLFVSSSNQSVLKRLIQNYPEWWWACLM